MALGADRGLRDAMVLRGAIFADHRPGHQDPVGRSRRKANEGQLFGVKPGPALTVAATALLALAALVVGSAGASRCRSRTDAGSAR